MKKNNLYKISVFFAAILAAGVVLYSCATMLEIDKIKWKSNPTEINND